MDNNYPKQMCLACLSICQSMYVLQPIGKMVQLRCLAVNHSVAPAEVIANHSDKLHFIESKLTRLCCSNNVRLQAIFGSIFCVNFRKTQKFDWFYFCF